MRRGWRVSMLILCFVFCSYWLQYLHFYNCKSHQMRNHFQTLQLNSFISLCYCADAEQSCPVGAPLSLWNSEEVLNCHKNRAVNSAGAGFNSGNSKNKFVSLFRLPCRQLEGASFAVLVAAFCLTLLFLYFWGQAKNDYNDFDWWVERLLHL